MKHKILYVTTVGGTMRFFRSFVKSLVEAGHAVDIAANINMSLVPELYNDLGCKIYPISCTRSPFNKGTLKAIREIKKIVEEGQYDIVHCHTPIAAMCTRLACRKARKRGVRVLYTAHGFHFYKGAPKKNWLLYYPVEKLCARYTDTLITINHEDYAFAEKKLKAREVTYVPGVGLDVKRFAQTTVDKSAKRREIGIPENAFMLLSVGELNANKNHSVVIRALAQINDNNIHYAVAGKGDKKDDLIRLAEELGVGNQVHLLGYRTDVAELYHASDIFVFPSFREGLSVSVMESLSCGLPVICSQIRGNVDLVQDGETGYWADPFNPQSFAEAIKKLEEGSDMSDRCRFASQKYEQDIINQKMMEIYDL